MYDSSDGYRNQCPIQVMDIETRSRIMEMRIPRVFGVEYGTISALVSQFKSIKSVLAEFMAPPSTVESSSSGTHGAVIPRIGLAPQPPADCWLRAY